MPSRQDMRRLMLLPVIVFVLFSAPLLYAQESPPFGNEDVIRMVAAGLGEALVIAKIEQAEAVELALEVDDLIDLKAAGVSEAVVQAMLKRSTEGEGDVFGGIAATPATASSAVSPADPMAFMREEQGHETIRVALETSEGQQLLRVQRGEFSTTGMGMFAFFDYPGLHSRTRTKDRLPHLLVKSRSQLTGGRYFLAKLDVDEDDGIRSLKVSSAKKRFKAMFGSSRTFSEPDKDWTVEYEVEEVGPDLWRVTPTEELEPGEYGWYVDLQTGMQASTIFDFGIDP